MSKLLKTMITSFVILLVGGAIVFVIVLNVTGKSIFGNDKSIEHVVKHAYETPEITTDLNDGSFVRIQFKILTDGKKAHNEITHRDFQIKNILIKELAPMNEDDFRGGLSELEDTIKVKLNEVMTDGEIIDVFTVNKILQ